MTVIDQTTSRYDADDVLDVLNATRAHRDALAARLAKYTCPIGSENGSPFCSAGQCPECVTERFIDLTNRLAEAERERDANFLGGAKEFRRAAEAACNDAIGRYKHEARNALVARDELHKAMTIAATRFETILKILQQPCAFGGFTSNGGWIASEARQGITAITSALSNNPTVPRDNP
jgi:hypothetical protein